MIQDDDNAALLERKGRHGGGASISNRYDPRVSSFINWAFATIGAVGVLTGLGVYNKLSEMNDTLIKAVSKLETQGSQIADLRNELAKQRDDMTALRAEVFTLEGRTFRGIKGYEDSARGH